MVTVNGFEICISLHSDICTLSTFSYSFYREDTYYPCTYMFIEQD